MAMIILHNSYDKASRRFISSLGLNDPNSPKIKVYDWYRGGKERFIADGYPDLQPSAFPSVLVETPAYEVVADPAKGRLTSTKVEAGPKLVRLPANISDVDAHIDSINTDISDYNATNPPGGDRSPVVKPDVPRP